MSSRAHARSPIALTRRAQACSQVVRIEVKDKKSLWINGVEAWKHEGGFDGWRFAVGGYAEQHAFEIVDFGSE